MTPPSFIAQSPGPDAATIFYITLLFIFVTAIVTTLATKWTRDKCLKLFRGYRITLERSRGRMLWGRLKVFSSGIEVVYDHAYVDPHGLQKTSFLFYQQELDSQVLAIFRYHEHLDEKAKRERVRQVSRTFNPRLFRRAWRGVRNIANTLRDAFNAAIGAAVTQFQRTNPQSAVLSTQGGAVATLGQTLLGRFANAYEPLLEQYIGQPVILEVADPINPNNLAQEYTGYLADYTQQFIAVLNVQHSAGEEIRVLLPNIERGEPLPPLPPPPPPGAAAPVLSPALAVESGVTIRVDGVRLQIQNTRPEVLAIRRLERQGLDPICLDMILPPMGTLSLPARDARGGRLICQVVRCLDVISPRRYSIVRHAGVLLERRGLAEDLQLDQLPLVSKLFAAGDEGLQHRRQ